MPSKELIQCQVVSVAGISDTEETAANCGYDLGLSAGNPALDPWGWKVDHSERRAVGADDIVNMGNGPSVHGTLQYKTFTATVAWDCQ